MMMAEFESTLCVTESGEAAEAKMYVISFVGDAISLWSQDVRNSRGKQLQSRQPSGAVGVGGGRKVYVAKVKICIRQDC
jgi:hypothetical protein